MFTLGSSNATSQGVLSGLSFQWSADAEGLTLESADERYQIKPIDNDGRMMFALITQWVDGEIKFRTAEWVARGDGLGDQLVADLPQTLPRYWQGGVGTYLAAHSDSDGELLSSSVFGYSFEENGMSDRVFSDPLQCEEESFELYCGAIFDPDDREWAWTHDGGTIVRESESSERLRTWEIVSYQPGGRAILLESETYRPNNQGEFEVLIYPRLNSIELRDLSEWPEEWAASAPNFEN